MRNRVCPVSSGRLLCYGNINYVIGTKNKPKVLGTYSPQLNRRDFLGIQSYGFEPIENANLEAEILREFLKTHNPKPRQKLPKRKILFGRFENAI